MIRIRNPHGTFEEVAEWTGKWSDELIESLPQDVKDEHNMTDKQDGEFYMSAEDFSTEAESVTICHVMQDHVANEELGLSFEDSVCRKILFVSLEIRSGSKQTFVVVD